MTEPRISVPLFLASSILDPKMPFPLERCLDYQAFRLEDPRSEL